MICKAVRDMTEMKVLISGKFDNQGSTTNESHQNLLCSSGYAYLYSEIQYLICFLSAGWQWILNLKLPPGICYLSSWKKGNCWRKKKVTARRWHQPCVHFQPQPQIKAIISKWLMQTSFHIVYLDGEQYYLYTES